MADHSLSPLDAYDPTAPTAVDLVLPGKTQGNEGAAAQSSGSGSAYSKQDAPVSPVDLALNLVFNEIAEQARLATTATGAAIALAHGTQIVCRATTGATAPDVAACLNNGSGISEACLRSGKVHLSDDAEADSRLDAAACRRLGARSILIVPVQQQEERLGVMAIFSPRANAFCDRDVLTLQALSRRVAANIDLAKQTLAQPGGAHLAASSSSARPSLKMPKPRRNVLSEIRNAHWLRSWNTFLMVLVIALSLLVGWTLGRSSRRPVRVAGHASAMVPPAAEPPQTQAVVTPPSTEPPAQAAEAPSSAELTTQPEEPPPTSTPDTSVAQVTIEDRRPVSRPSRGKAKLGAEKSPSLSGNGQSASKAIKATGGTPADSMLVFENKKLASQERGSQPLPASAQDVAGKISISAASGAKGNTDSTRPISIPEETAQQYLIRRVEPVFPDAARQQHIHGRVVVDVIVGKDGSVQGIGQVSGDPQLMRAAGDAIRQWQFKPFLQNGQPVKFESRITLDFVLP
ncbi:MAG TPA: TonB family protein [Terriglobales bacterium]|nr:TonB family protein [Terriglobales bacterium]